MSSSEREVAVITGAGSGIGRSLAILCASKGYALAIADVNEGGLQETVELLRWEGVEPGSDTSPLLVQQLDVSKRDAVDAFAKSVAQKFSYTAAPTLVFNNAGVALSQNVADLAIADFEWIMSINFWGVVYGTKAFLPAMLKANRGTIVNVSSIFGVIAVPSQGAYNASKFAVRGFTEALQHELIAAKSGVAAVVVCPGGIKTNIARSARFFVDPDGNKVATTAHTKFDAVAHTTAAEAAAIMLAGALAAESRVYVGSDAKLLALISRFWPTGYWPIIQWLTNLTNAESPIARFFARCRRPAKKD